MTLSELAEKVAEDQEAIDGQCEDTRTRVIRMGKRLREMQELQKAEQEETGQTWEEYCEEQKSSRGTFPSRITATRYTLISQYPEAYKSGATIKEAYKEAGRWKKNGGMEPPKEKVSVPNTLPDKLGRAAGRLLKHLDTFNAKDNWDDLRSTEGWDPETVWGVNQMFIEIDEAVKIARKLFNAATTNEERNHCASTSSEPSDATKSATKTRSSPRRKIRGTKLSSADTE